MMGKKALTLVVPHYKEPWETGKPLFDSIALQHGIDFEKLGFDNIFTALKSSM